MSRYNIFLLLPNGYLLFFCITTITTTTKGYHSSDFYYHQLVWLRLPWVSLFCFRTSCKLCIYCFVPNCSCSVHIYFLKSALFRYNVHTIICTHIKWTVWGLTNVHTCVIATTIENISSLSKIPFCLFAVHPCLPLPMPCNLWSAFCWYRLVCLF